MEKETLEEAKNNAWQNYEYGQGHLYSRTFFDAFELGYNLAKEQDKNKFSEEEIKNLFNHPVMDRIRSSKSDAEARRIILQQFKKK